MARIRVQAGGTLRDITQIKAMSGGVLRTITSVKVMVSGVMQTVYTAGGVAPPTTTLAITANPGSVQGSTSSTANTKPKPIFTDTVMATASGGTAPYTYAWVKKSDDGLATWSAANQSASSTNFKATGVGPDSGSTARFICVVTDSASPPASVTSNEVVAEVYNSLEQ